MVVDAKYLICATGLLHKRYIPDYCGLELFKGQLHHTAAWPEDLTGQGKKCAVIGCGATAVQVIQELAKTAEKLVVYMRRPSTCFPMQQRNMTVEEQEAFYPNLAQHIRGARKTGGGFYGISPEKSIFNATPEERDQLWSRLAAAGGFALSVNNYREAAMDLEANRLVYDWWRQQVHKRMKNKEKAELMAPKEPMYPIYTKRPPLEQDLYEMIDRDNVELVNLLENPIEAFDASGIKTKDGVHRNHDIIALATGFDSYSGTMTRMGLKNTDGKDLKECWQKGVWSYLGLMVHGFPNMFMVYSPHGMSTHHSCHHFES